MSVRVLGDTRRVRQIVAVRRLALAGLMSGVAGCSALVAAGTLLARAGTDPAVLPWILLGALAAAGLVARVAYLRAPAGVRTAAFGMLVAALAVALGGAAAVPAAAGAGTLLAAWALGGGAGLAASAAPRPLRSAALGWYTACAALGLLPAGHVAVVGGGSWRSAGWWLVAYTGAALLLAHRAVASAPADRRAATEREDPPRRPASLLSLERLEVRFGETPVLRGVDLTLSPGEVVVLAGTNGAGKTTLLRAAAGFLHPTRGAVRLEGEDVTGTPPELLARLGIAFVDGSRPVFGELTVEENLRVGAFLTHRSRTSFDRATAAVWELFGMLRDRRGDLAGTLSGGEQRILAIAQALYSRPRVLLCDELTTGLAAGPLGVLLEAVRSLAAAGTAVVLVEHDLPTILAAADRVVFLDAGVVRYEGTPDGLLERADLLRPVLFAGGGA